MDFFSGNQHVDYPQKIFEVGDAVLIDESKETRSRDVRKLSVAWADSRMGYEKIASALDALLKELGVSYKLKKSVHPRPTIISETLFENSPTPDKPLSVFNTGATGFILL